MVSSLLGPIRTPHNQADLHTNKKNLIFPISDEIAGRSVQSMNIYVKLSSSQGCRLGVMNIDCSINVLGLKPQLCYLEVLGKYSHSISALICQMGVRTGSPTESCCVGPMS